MKHIFYVIYVLSFSGAVFITGMFVGQFLERLWSAREEKAREREKVRNPGLDPVGIPIRNSASSKTGRGE